MLYRLQLIIVLNNPTTVHSLATLLLPATLAVRRLLPWQARVHQLLQVVVPHLRQLCLGRLQRSSAVWLALLQPLQVRVPPRHCQLQQHLCQCWCVAGLTPKELLERQLQLVPEHRLHHHAPPRGEHAA